MAPWGPIAATYGVVLAVSAAVRLRGWRRAAVMLGSIAYAGAAAWISMFSAAWIHLAAPGAALLGGYWLSGPFVDDPQVSVERWLLSIDHRICTATGCRGWVARAPHWVLESLEVAYTADYVVVGGGALLVWPLGSDAVLGYWAIVLGAELTCYAALPWIRTRPPRAVEPPGAIELRDPYFRRLNFAVLHRASVHANTIPSGHVAGAVAASLAVMMHLPAVGVALLAVSALISVAAVVGRYHYVVDVILGALVALVAAAVEATRLLS
ncbi:MAG: phosphatase PAP2 family protein [Acidobacteria bacterium]|nr:phosphatase PAP2 family protein [Acidobacteriota bacterium]